LEDISLSMPENSNEYRLLVSAKGREEIEKRRFFLLRVTSNTDKHEAESLATKSALKRSAISS